MHDAPVDKLVIILMIVMVIHGFFSSKESQQLFCEIWKKIAARYKILLVILGYDLLNEPFAPYFNNMDELNAQLEPLYKLAVKGNTRS